MSVADLHALLAVQDLDLAIDQHRHRRAHLPELAELTAIDSRINDIQSSSKLVEATRLEVEARQTKAETELAATEERAASVSRRLYGGEVSASRELQAMAADVDNLKARASALEDEILAVLEEREPLDQQLSALQAELASLEQDREAVAVRLADAQRIVDGEIAGLERQRGEVIETVPAELLETYERLRARLGGVGVARLVGDHCDGCHLALPAVELDRIRHLPAGEVSTCDQCGRILVPSSASS